MTTTQKQVLVGATILTIVLFLFFGFSVANEVAIALNPGLGLKGASVLGFILTVVVMVVLVVASEGGLLGEVQYLLGAFFPMFAVLTILLAWAF